MPEKESAEYQEGKVRAFGVLIPYARLGQFEHAAVVLKKDGTRYYDSIGSAVQVGVRTPAKEKVAVLHTHDYEGGHSSWDWSQFLTSESTEQSHVLTATTTYSLHKPPGWKAEDYGISSVIGSDSQEEAQAKKNPVERAYAKLEGPLMLKDNSMATSGWEEKFSISIAKELAARYGIIFRTGRR